MAAAPEPQLASTPARRVPPDVPSLLDGLGVTVRSRLVREASSEHLGAELNMLASILRLLARELPNLPAEQAADVADARQALAEAGLPDAGEPLRALADQVRGAASPPPPLRGYLRRNVHRGLTGLVATGDLGPAPASQVDAAPAAARVDREAVDERLRAYLSSAGAVSAIERRTEGYGAETVICTVVHDAVETRYVIRIQWPDLPMRVFLRPVAEQAAAIRVAAAAGVPVPGVIDVLSDEGILGGPALVTEFVDGYVPTNWTREGRHFTAELARIGASEFMAHYARIHGAEWRGGFAEHLEPADAVERQRRRLAAMDRTYRDTELRPDPLIEAVLAHLAHALEGWGEPVLIHGDYRPGNIIYGPDHSVRAVIDWDCAVVNDFHEELGHSVAWPWRENGLACGILTDADLLGTYSRLTGRRVVSEAVLYYQLQATFRRYLGFAALARAWLQSGGDVRMARAWLALAQDRIELEKLLP